MSVKYITFNAQNMTNYIDRIHNTADVCYSLVTFNLQVF